MQILSSQDARLYSTFRLPALLQQVYLIEQVADLQALPPDCQPLVLGEGSNSIFLTDMTQPVLRFMPSGVAIQQQDDAILLHVDAGHNWHQLVSWTVAQGWWGLQNLALIPGSVGAAPVQNIGAYGVELMDCCDYVDFYHWQSRQIQRLLKAECQFGYRDSIFKHALAGQGLIVAVGLRLTHTPQRQLSYKGLDLLPADATLPQIFDAVIAVRQSKLPNPAQLANCGSFFKNPLLAESQFQQLQLQYPTLPAYPQPDGQIKTAAAWLIEQAGFKGGRHGDIGCYPLQPLVLVNYGKGTAAELLHWIDSIINKVEQQFGIRLEPEVRLLRDS